MIKDEIQGTKSLLQKVIEGIEEKKGKDIVRIHIGLNDNSISDYFVICHGTSKTQVEAIADSVVDTVRNEIAQKPWHIEGYENSEWILIDYVDVVVHVFEESKRSFYKLEELWGDSEIEYLETKYESE
ncbi:MAG: ribosome silencing factor [Bacteroidetes bacterium]|nr:ribosome silencing factor [Bacteroidota bacterium]